MVFTAPAPKRKAKDAPERILTATESLSVPEHRRADFITALLHYNTPAGVLSRVFAILRAGGDFVFRREAAVARSAILQRETK